ncbi:hypothetical protein LPJ64_000798 [Coemansia asiatica]|uniref:RNA-binding domain-containing protein n=1 Tax=Coemansia asiatica TaxID=1052880 RepID=A0A9W8CM21_9FUNG|nr:hypothetical protein LPJ64_000798 [Coemansia asiatica]
MGATTQLFVGRLPRELRSSELERIFEKYGKLSRCDVKRGANLCYGFVEYEDVNDAEDAIKQCNGLSVQGERIVVEFAKGAARKRDDNTCFRCNQEGHWARDCPDSRRGGGARSRSPRRSHSRGHGRERDRDRDRGRRNRNDRRESSRSRRHRSRSRSRSRSRTRSASPSRKHGNRTHRSSHRTRGTRSSRRSRSHSRNRTNSRSRSRSSGRAQHTRGNRSRNRGGSSRRHGGRSKSPNRSRGADYADRDDAQDWEKKSVDSAVGGSAHGDHGSPNGRAAAHGQDEDASWNA